MPRWMYRHTRRDKLRNEVIRDKVGVALGEDKMWEARLRWYGYVKRMSIDAPVRRCERLAMSRLRRGIGRPRKYWGEVIRQGMTHLQLTEDMTLDRKTWRLRIKILHDRGRGPFSAAAEVPPLQRNITTYSGPFGCWGDDFPQSAAPQDPEQLSSAEMLRNGLWNIGTLTRKSIELERTLQKRKVNIACVQETRWEGSRAGNSDGYKLWYLEGRKGKNGVGILVDRELRESVIESRWVNDRLMAIKLVVGGITLNIINVYAPQTGLDEKVKRCFWEGLDEVVRVVLLTEKLFI
uniref:Craniofacial development protein 2-like n=1 Tax=Nicotiana tabacum TaxID=4097 RepID=A0A1S3YG78_TOBAC|nr:PREDICTED: craniofacial development protein 2-like [Nicotiana tabacum]